MKQMSKRVVLFALCALMALAPLALADETAIIDKYIENREAAIPPSPTPEATATPVPTAMAIITICIGYTTVTAVSASAEYLPTKKLSTIL